LGVRGVGGGGDASTSVGPLGFRALICCDFITDFQKCSLLVQDRWWHDHILLWYSILRLLK
jgi:hypothetical protein